LVIALDGITLDIGEGEFVALMGPSGSGKSTLLNLLGGLDRPTAGEVWVGDLELGHASETALTQYRRHQVGFVFQSFNLLPRLTARENVALPMALARIPAATRRRRAETLLERVALRHRANHYPSELSGGEQQRVALARALANLPALILADEPTGNLDSRTGHEILALLHQINRKEMVTVAVVTHDPAVAAYADRVVHLRDGQVKGIEERVP
jgi:putative ABC transport system ATP-binding protein